MARTLVVFRREWLELRQNKTYLQTLFFFPVLLVVLPSGVVAYFIATLRDFAAQAENPYVPTAGTFSGTDNPALLAGVIVLIFSFFLPVPAVLPMLFATNSVISEKEKRSLEPLLVTPIKTGELVSGKALAAIVPTCLATWFCFSLLVGLLFVISPPNALSKVDFPLWCALIFGWTPIIAAWTALAGIAISSRARDARAATQIGSLMVLPFIGLVAGVVLGVLVMNWLIFFGGLVAGILLVFVTYLITLKIFERENILTRWK
jgi:ABC-2 type transport system permease protein